MKLTAENQAPAGRRGGVPYPSGTTPSGCGVAPSKQGSRAPVGVGVPLRDITNSVASATGGAQQFRPAKRSTTTATSGPIRGKASRAAAALFDEGDELWEGGQTAAEYIPDILERLFSDELHAVPAVGYLEAQPEVNHKMRAILVDWLVEVHLKYRLQAVTLHLTVNLIDRYMSRAKVARKRLQLVGVVALFVAAKFEEVNPPTAAQLAHMTDNTYTVEDIFSLECSFLTVLEFKILVPTAVHFLDHLTRVNRCDALHGQVAMYVLELGLLDHRLMQYEPSRLAASALLLSNELMGRNPAWPTSMAVASRHALPSIKGCLEELRAVLDAAPQNSLHTIQRKYSEHQEHMGVAKRLESMGSGMVV